MRSLLLLLCLATSLPGQSATAHLTLPTRAELDSISSRGIALYEYDRAAWVASDALMEQRPEPRSAQYYLVVRTEHDWNVYFGRLTDAEDTLYIVYSAREAVGDSVFSVTKLPTPVANTGDELHAARALVTARKAFGPTSRPYNHSVIPTGDGDWWVYLYPAQTVTNFWPLGGDERFRMSADGTRIIDRHRMHVTVLETPTGANADSAGRIPQSYYHSAIVDNRPEDTDVLAVLSRSPRLPEYIPVKPGFVYRIDINGHITLPMKL